jgi:hypothetical protein
MKQHIQNLLFHEPNQKFDRTSIGWVHSDIKHSDITLPTYVGS